MSREVWEKAKEGIQKDITYALQSELRQDMSSRTRRIVQAELENLVRPLIKERMNEIKAVAEKTVSRIIERMEASVLEKFRGELSYGFDRAFEEVGRSIASAFRSAMHGVIEKASEELRTAQERAHLEKQKMQEKKDDQAPGP
ncbi:MAG: hypothetical protein LUQ37_04520 [Methanoregulaceae archaeon]|nr:hypothetical protein [Methanoregulaceae archaeon]